jgi:dienelactone hydrolase
MKKIILFTVLLVVSLGLAGFIFWANNALGPMPEAEAAMQSDASVQVSKDEWIIFQPTGGNPQTGLIIYPGGRVDPVSYAPIARQIAAQGYLVSIVPMPLNLAFFGANRAGEIMEAFPQIENWAIAGHSLGGSMAASFSESHADVDGLVLWAAYPAGSSDLSDNTLEVSSISSTNDGLVTPDDIATSVPLLPPGASFMQIQGGNHAQFGWYGDQPGDGIATISRQDQQNQIAAETLRILKTIDTSN